MSEVWEELCEQREYLRHLVRRVSDNEEGRELLIERTHDHQRELAANHAAFFELVRLVDRQQERIARLEKIIVSMANGNKSSAGDVGSDGHTHWVYPVNGAWELVEEIKSPSPDPPLGYLWGDGNQASNQASQSRLVGEEPEPDGARWRDPDGARWVRLCPLDLAQDERERQMDEKWSLEPDRARYREDIGVCARCGDACVDDLCVDCESDIAEEARINKAEMWPAGRPEGLYL